ncbi:hypothetical protein JMJ77_0013619 [Colletotrichum scovillei]|uniref:Uncharacterized protein n=1 Tax=Colletotrichum scovillei TaxID=1209932 RepID=A0A9P7QQA9_9PEZI|nr:hypothetical protein JMJ78_0012907 [Colletotrichum scovillei]KAG7040622.1 hypothetical protein JMJ77_0013619 [Colletotrichum scovillei]KAG7060669.1 hypothetical protein JMJ76_0006212 [Colletotrichum scovillei]
MNKTSPTKYHKLDQMMSVGDMYYNAPNEVRMSCIKALTIIMTKVNLNGQDALLQTEEKHKKVKAYSNRAKNSRLLESFMTEVHCIGREKDGSSQFGDFWG